MKCLVCGFERTPTHVDERPCWCEPSRAYVDRLYDEIARLRDIISPGDAAAYEEGMAGKDADIERLKNEVAWQEERNANNVRAYTEEIERLKTELVEKDHKLACAWERRDEAEDRLAKVIEVGDRIVARNCGDAEAELWAKAKEKEQHGSSLL